MIIKIENVGNVAFPDSMNKEEITKAAAKLHAQANRPKARQPVLGNVSAERTTFIASDGSVHSVFTRDLDKARQIDPRLKVISQ